MTGPRAASAAWTLLPFAVALALALPLLGAEYAFHDDWTYLEGATGAGLAPALDSSLAQGRPLHVLVSIVSWSAAESVADLRLLRALGVAGALALALVAGRWLRGLGQGATVAAAAAAGVVVLAPVALAAAWAALWPSPWIAAAAFVVGSRIDRRARATESAAGARRAAAFDLAALVALFLAYPPAAFAVLVPPVAGPLAERRGSAGGTAIRGPLAAVGLLALAAPLVVVLQWAARRLAAPELPASDRMDLVAIGEIPGRLAWLVREPLARAFDLAASPTRHAASIAVGLVVVAGVALAIRRRGLGAAAIAASLAGGFLLTCAAAWLPAERHFAYRTILPATLLAWLLLVVAVRELAGRVAGTRRGPVLAGALLGVGALALAVRTIGGLVPPLIETHERELALLREAARRIVAERPHRVLVRRIDWRRARRPGRWGEWSAFPSAADHWYPGAMVRLATREAGAELDGAVEVVDADEAARRGTEPATFVVDYSAAFERRAAEP